MVLLGKALGGGILPVSAVVSRDEVLGVLRPGEHGSTFGRNPLALAIAREVIAMLREGDIQQRAAELSEHMLERLRAEAPPTVKEVRGRGCGRRGGVRRVRPGAPALRAGAGRWRDRRETHETTLRLAPPLTISRADLDHGIDVVLSALV